MTGPIPIWWRDDDAIEDTVALRRLLAIKQRWNVPLALAVVPAKAQTSLARLTESLDLDVLVHGFAHENRANPDARKAEFHEGRTESEMRRELRAAIDVLTRTMPQTLPVFVPPWNRFPHALMEGLRDAGFAGFSASGLEANWPAPAGLTVANAHIDVLDWRAGAAAKPLAHLVEELDTMVASHQGAPDRPIGLLTHHLQMPDAAFSNLDRLFHCIATTPALSWTRARSIFPRAKGHG